MIDSAYDDEIMAKSIELLTNNFFITTHELPAYFYKAWDNFSKDKSNFNELGHTTPLAVFLFAYSYYKGFKNNTSEIELAEDEIAKKFSEWQSVLCFYVSCTLANYETTPIKIFDFDNYDNIKMKVKKKN